MPATCVLICGGRWHDFDYARRELSQRLARHPGVHTTAFDDYDCVPALAEADLLVSYTCDVRARLAQQTAVVDLVARGGRWLALHGTNVVSDDELSLAEVLGSRFIEHPPIHRFRVEVTRPEHPLVAGIGAFDVTDELYLCELSGPLEVLAHTQYDGQPRPMLYLRTYGSGQVCYLPLGHVDAQGKQGSWPVPEFSVLLDRAIAWAIG